MSSVTTSNTPHEAPTALIPVADGSEEIEAVTLADVLVRGGVQVTVASVGQKEENVVKMSRGVKVQGDLAIEACVDLSFDAIIVPGGLPGATNLRDSSVLIDLLKKQKQEDKLYGAICAAPAVVLYPHGLLPSPATGYPGSEKDLEAIDFKKDERVVVTGKCVTSQGPGTAMEMGVKLVELLCGKEKAVQVAKGLLVPVMP
ncbi:hypothetical protein Poli38472_006792 [Pythium oligandrum]|uniref:DJ-1/PfpI domain-containing protein n=1 Tax=Pythium oligandrum TaxID=41045 RepID=A0A8K1C5A2_PYTOL|nr:hypothetical protein Poli38472_006792 [Pythium oligandrum]|eukprot:TMW56782.1 hypothetical protein Poli38472_006792 [Pythium oligandrum]